MAELIVRGKEAGQQWRRTFPDGPVVIGRSNEASWIVPWDLQISRRHAEATWDGTHLHVRRLPSGKNQIFFQNNPADDFLVPPGGHFVIGETIFTVVAETDLPTPDSELTFSVGELRGMRFDDADERIAVLATLPGIIRMSPSEEELESRVVDVLLRGIRRTVFAAVVAVDLKGEVSSPVEVRTILAGRGHDTRSHQPSRRLIHEAVRQRRQGVVHLWNAGALDGRGAEYTNTGGNDWALCVPVSDPHCPGWALYVSGRSDGMHEADARTSRRLQSDLKFADLVADVFGSMRHLIDLQRRQGAMSRFLSRSVRLAVGEKDMDEVLKARETEVTVLFCDLRGSCRLHEESRHELMALWGRVSEALGIMSSSIIAEDGVIGDFQGDAAMGFWGWPLSQPDQIERAARAALTIWRRFALAGRDSRHALHAFACGLGIAHGTAIAGRLGTSDQFKVDVFGPVVNLAARLESMTKFFGVPILMDEACGERIREVSPSWARVRRLARVRPYGMTQDTTIHELLPPAVEGGRMPEDHRAAYELMLHCFHAGRWPEALQRIAEMPEDGGSRFLRAFMEKHGRPPRDWDGIVAMEGK